MRLILALSSALAAAGCQIPKPAARAPAPVTLTGTARDAKMGAVLVTAGGHVWIDLEAWPDAVRGRTLRVTGRYVLRADVPAFEMRPDDLPRAGVPVPPGADVEAARRRRVLTDVKWAIAEPGATR